MKKLIKYTFLLSIALLFTACGSPYRQVKLNEVIQNHDLSYKVPDTNWEIHKGYSKEKYQNKRGIPGLYSFKENMQFAIYTDPFSFMEISMLFDKDADYVARHKRLSRTPETKAQDEEQGITYRKGWVAYVNHLKCTGNVYSRGFREDYSRGGIKWYSLTCGYYDTTETKVDGKRTLRITYRYTHNTRTNKGQQRQHIIKDAIRKTLQNFKIKNIDVKRMEKEGLMHYDEKFESTKW